MTHQLSCKTHRVQLSRYHLLIILHKIKGIPDQINFILINSKFYEVSLMTHIIFVGTMYDFRNIHRLVRMYPNHHTIRIFIKKGELYPGYHGLLKFRNASLTI